MKRVLSILLTVALFFTLQAVAGADVKQVTLSDIDQILRDSGTPENIISGLDDELKQMIYENSGSSPELKFIEVQQEVVPQLFASGYSIPSSDLKIEVLAFSVGNGKADIYPIYEWLKPVKPKGKDYFGYSTHSDFSVVANTRSNLIWYKLNSGDNWTSAGAATYTGSSLTGYEHSGSSLGTPDFPIYIKGNFSFRVDIDKTNPVKKIAISYVHDTSSGGTFGYSIGYGPAYISVTPSSSNVGYNTNVYNLVF